MREINENTEIKNVEQVKLQLNYTDGAWKDFLENQIGPPGKGKTLKELKNKGKHND